MIGCGNWPGVSVTSVGGDGGGFMLYRLQNWSTRPLAKDGSQYSVENPDVLSTKALRVRPRGRADFHQLGNK